MVKTIHLAKGERATRKPAPEQTAMSSEHFREELLSQMVRAAACGAKHILVNSRELHCSLGDFPGANYHSTACCDVMESEMKAGDVCVVDKSNGYGLTIRYLLPRAS